MMSGEGLKDTLIRERDVEIGNVSRLEMKLKLGSLRPQIEHNWPRADAQQGPRTERENKRSPPSRIMAAQHGNHHHAFNSH